MKDEGYTATYKASEMGNLMIQPSIRAEPICDYREKANPTTSSEFTA